jgi:TetR/AcrR family transcriptional regulator, copper-responsive repressor
MVQKKAQKRVGSGRGRPRAYDPDAALSGARDAFWRQGYSATSLEVLSDATDMNRPSMYAAFGDKHALYLQTLDRYTIDANASIELALDRKHSLAEGLRRFYDNALAIYFGSGGAPRGCYLIGTATTEAGADPEVSAKLLAALRGFERAIEARMSDAKAASELDAAADPAALAMMASAVLHSIAVRSRAGESRASLKALTETAIQLICTNFRPAAPSARPTKTPA